MVKFTPAKIDSNTWWQVTEGRVDTVGSNKYRSGMFVADAGNDPNGPIVVYVSCLYRRKKKSTKSPTRRRRGDGEETKD